MIHRGRRWIMRFDLSDEEWALLEPLLPKSRKSARADDRKIMNAIFYVLRTGMPWRDLPERYGPYTTAYNRFNRWSRRGIWKRIFDALASKSCDSLYLIDSTIVTAHRAASGAKTEAEKLGVEFLGELPLDIAIRETSDEGNPIVWSQPQSEHAQVYRAIAARIWEKLGLQQRQAPKIVIE